VTVDDGDLMDVFAHVARSLAAMDDVQKTLQQIVDIAADVVPGADHAAVSLVMRRREVQTTASTDDVCDRIDQAQYETGQGPCLEAIWNQEVVKIGDLAHGDRWPEFAKTPVSLGIRSMLSFRLFTDEDTAGALNLYAAAPVAFSDESIRVGHVLAAHAAVGLEHAQEVAGLERSIASREVIGKAQGILMERHKIRGDEAFDLLRRASQARNMKLREIAGTVVETGGMPGD
jgi:transcriptional regulator with GAF, ATPase, and Fis domain